MVEVVLLEYLTDALNGVYVAMEKPKQKPETYVVLHRIDSGMVNQIAAATFSIMCYAPTLYKVTELAKEVKKALLNIDVKEVASAKLGGESVSTRASEMTYESELIFNFNYYEED